MRLRDLDKAWKIPRYQILEDLLRSQMISLCPLFPLYPEMGMNEDIAEEIRRFEEMGSSQDRFYIDQYRRGSQDAERIAYYVLRSQGLSPQDAKNRIDNMTPEELSQMRPGGFKNGGETRRPFPALLQDNASAKRNNGSGGKRHDGVSGFNSRGSCTRVASYV